MISLSAALGVATIAFGMVVAPGPNMVYLVSRSLVQGRTAGMVSLAGVITGLVVYVLATTLGLALLFAVVPELFVAIKVAGVAYLIYLAWGMVRGSHQAFTPDASLPPHSTWRLYLTGLATCMLNPKVALMYGALLPQFVDPANGPTSLQLIEVGLVQIAVATLGNMMWVVLAGCISDVLRRSRRVERGVRWTAGGLLTGFAIHRGVSRASA